jgi:hypothetical protein
MIHYLLVEHIFFQVEVSQTEEIIFFSKIQPFECVHDGEIEGAVTGRCIMLIDKKRERGSVSEREGDGEIEGAVTGRGIMLIDKKKIIRTVKEKLKKIKNREDDEEGGSEGESESEIDKEAERKRAVG